MQIATIIGLIVFTIGFSLVSGFAIVQTRRFHYINKRTRIITWTFSITAMTLLVGSFVMFFTIDF